VARLARGGCNPVAGVDVGSWGWKYSDFKDFSNFFTQSIIELERILDVMIFKIYECVLRNFENLHFSVPWHPPRYRKVKLW